MDEQFSWRLRQISKAQSRLVIILAGKERERERDVKSVYKRERSLLGKEQKMSVEPWDEDAVRYLANDG